jgi:hypothetical protein
VWAAGWSRSGNRARRGALGSAHQSHGATRDRETTVVGWRRRWWDGSASLCGCVESGKVGTVVRSSRLERRQVASVPGIEAAGDSRECRHCSARSAAEFGTSTSPVVPPGSGRVTFVGFEDVPEVVRAGVANGGSHVANVDGGVAQQFLGLG